MLVTFYYYPVSFILSYFIFFIWTLSQTSSICAQICHKGHDVGYSRSSSFYCDCGAESSNDAKNHHVPCKCLSPLSTNNFKTILECDQSFNDSDNVLNTSKQINTSKLKKEEAIFKEKVLSTLVHCFPSCTSQSLDNFIKKASKSIYTQNLFKNFNLSFQSWSDIVAKKKKIPYLIKNDILKQLEGNRDIQMARHLSLNSRSGQIVVINYLKDLTFVPIRKAKANSLRPKISLDTVIEQQKKCFFTKNDIKRNILVADHRGRVIVAETSCLLFCAGLTSVYTRHLEKPLETSSDRSSINILGSTKVKFPIIGMTLCSDNSCRLVVWGTSEAVVFILSKSWDKVEKVITLAIELEPQECESEYVLKAEWMPCSLGVSRFFSNNVLRL